MKLRDGVSLAAMTLLTPLSILSAQRAEVGTYLRISHDCRTQNSPRHGEQVACRTTKGALAVVTTDTLFLTAPTGAVSRRSIDRLDLRVRRNQRLKGAVIGALAGIGLGVGVGAIAVSSCTGELCDLWYVITVPSGLVVGTVTGVIAGGGEKWRAVPLDVLGAGQFHVLPKAFKLGVAIAF
jgi:hypothetical protein